MYLNSAPFWLRSIYPKGLEWSMNTRDKSIYLTFDDGPIPEVTPVVLEILGKFNLKATFFCVGENVAKYPETYKLLIENGHAIGNHTFHHTKTWKTEFRSYIQDVRLCNDLVQSKLFRPPHGQITRKIASELRKDYRLIMWSALTGDYDTNLTAEQCLRTAIRYTRPGAIIVFHDSLKAQPRMEYTLPHYIEYCLQKGYQFRTIE